MTTPPDNTPPERLEDQLRNLLKNANLSFMMPGAAPAAAAAPKPEEPPAQPVEDPLRMVREFKLRPREVRDYLDRFVIRQDEAKKVLSVAVCDHYNHVRQCVENPTTAELEYLKHNVVLLGPTGVGKTYLMRCIAKLIGVPFVKADATKFSETGYVGRDVDDLVRDLVKAADGNVELAQYGIIYLDEVDKIAAQSGIGKDVSGRGVQTTLLKLMEETDVSLFSQTDIIGQMQAIMDMQHGSAAKGPRTINTRHILFIMSGAFDALPALIRKRVKSSVIGFSPKTADGRTPEDEEAAFLRAVQTRDLIDYGFEPEFVGRLPVRVVCDPLNVDDLEQVMLRSEGSVLRQYERDFAGYGLELKVSPEAVREIAEQAQGEKTGARGLMTVLERTLRHFKFELPSTGIKALHVGRETVKSPESVLSTLLEESVAIRLQSLEADVLSAAEAFERDTGTRLQFNNEAIQTVARICLDDHITIARFWSERFHDLEYGFGLISRNTGKNTFKITKKFVLAPAETLSAMVAKSFQDTKTQSNTE
jgi:endopeptidase Clp ATP-binding regulatory subunit ClpX